MKATGIVRRIDDLGRVVIPKEIRRTMRIREGDPLEIYTDHEGEVIFKKYSPIAELSEFARGVHLFNGLALLLRPRDNGLEIHVHARVRQHEGQNHLGIFKVGHDSRVTLESRLNFLGYEPGTNSAQNGAHVSQGQVSPDAPISLNQRSFDSRTGCLQRGADPRRPRARNHNVIIFHVPNLPQNQYFRCFFQTSRIS